MLIRHCAAAVLTLYYLVFCNTQFVYSQDVDQLISSSIEQFNNTRDYTCILDKKVLKRGQMFEERNIYVKYMKPTHYYFRWNSGIQKGQEVIFAAGKNNDKVVAHPGSIFKFITLRLDPESSMVMKKNRHSLMNSGMEKIISLVELTYTQARDAGLETVQIMGEERIDDRDVIVLEGRFPENQGFYAHRVIVSFDRELKLPIMVSVYDWSNMLVEEYHFRNLEINVGLGESDFDLHNPAYHFY